MQMAIYNLTIPGEPVSKARPRVGVGGAYTPAKTKNYETLVKEMFYYTHGSLLLDGPIFAVIKAYFPIPKSESKKKRSLMATEIYYHTKSKDVDNIAKAILDSLNGVAYHDDKQVARLVVEKFYSETPRVELMLSVMEQYQN